MARAHQEELGLGRHDRGRCDDPHGSIDLQVGCEPDPAAADLRRREEDEEDALRRALRRGVEQGWLQAVELPKTLQVSCFGSAADGARRLCVPRHCLGTASALVSFTEWPGKLHQRWLGAHLGRSQGPVERPPLLAHDHREHQHLLLGGQE